MIKNIELIVRNRFHVTICSLAAVWGWAQLTGYPLLPEDLIIVPLIMYSIYQWNRIYDLKEDYINTPGNAKNALKNIQWIAITCFICLVISFVMASLRGNRLAIIFLFLVLGLGIFYSTPVNKKRLKEIYLVKNLTSSLGWSLITILYPIIHSGSSLNIEHWTVFIIMFSAVWIVELIWDIRDVKGDKQFHVNTIPVVHGILKAKQFIMALDVFIICLVLGGFIIGNFGSIWLFIVLNNLLIIFWIYIPGSKLLENRTGSHLLVFIQTILLTCLGILSKFQAYITSTLDNAGL